MIMAQQGLLERQSLEDSCFVADGEDSSGCEYRDRCAIDTFGPDEFVVSMPVFTRPLPASRSSTCTSSSGASTPPLSSSDGSSISEGSQSSIDLSQMGRSQAPVCARGKCHRRRYSKSHASRSSVYEMIEEEVGPSRSRSIASKRTIQRDANRSSSSIRRLSVHSKGRTRFWMMNEAFSRHESSMLYVTRLYWRVRRCGWLLHFLFSLCSVSSVFPVVFMSPDSCNVQLSNPVITLQECELCLNTRLWPFAS